MAHMKTAAELEAELAQAAGHLRELQKAAKDQAARNTAEPAEPLRRMPGEISLPQRPTLAGR